jgi:hypothetical protein
MEEDWYADRIRLRQLLRDHPDRSHRAHADAIGRSLGWVKKWTRRLRAAAPDDDEVVRGQSRARKHPPPPWDPRVVYRILEIRDQPPENLRRIPGPRAILYYLQRDADLQALGVPLPRSTRTIWRLLTQHGRIVHLPRPPHEAVERPDPLTSWQLDFKDATTVAADPEGKQQHVVEVLNTVDVGTSILLDAQAEEDFTAQTSVEAVAQLLRLQGLPDRVTFDRDPRFVGSWSNRDFPSPFVRFWACLGVQVTICPPHRPDKNAFVERYHRSYTGECLRVERPGTLEEVRTATATYKEHYNVERPNQALSCGNRPPRVAFPELPARPPVPLLVDPDAWLRAIDGRSYVRKVRENGTALVDDTPYYVGQTFAGQYVGMQVDASSREFAVLHRGQEVKRLPIKGLQGGALPFDAFVAALAEQARTERSTRPLAAG